mmetsp:Transcript_30812/g.59462  ORF Transcript_30812/g.59462 Transcript_30812/m.59462 type:complete len:259 (-) Transcript_30812:143-919(-)
MHCLSSLPSLAATAVPSKCNARTSSRVPIRCTRVRCDATTTSQNYSQPLATARRVGLDASEGIFGFTPFSEMWTGRLAMAGFTTGIVEEMLTGHPILQQVGLGDGLPNEMLLTAILLLLGGATAIAAARTLSSVQNGDMSVLQFRRWAQLFGLGTEEDAQVVAYMKKAEPDAMNAFQMNKFYGDAPSCEWPRQDVALSVAWPQQTAREAEASMKYARGVEIINGRAAMLGFVAAIAAEAASGAGVVDQLIVVAKVFGF